jgi:hypothetical protein
MHVNTSYLVFRIHYIQQDDSRKGLGDRCDLKQGGAVNGTSGVSVSHAISLRPNHVTVLYYRHRHARVTMATRHVVKDFPYGVDGGGPWDESARVRTWCGTDIAAQETRSEHNDQNASG